MGEGAMKVPKTLAWLVPCLVGAGVDGAWTDYATHDDERLAALIAEALERNPGVRAAYLAEASATERIPVDAALSDPMVQLTGFAQSPQTRVGPQTSGVAVTQTLPWFGKRADRAEASTVQAEIKREQANAQRAELVRQVKLAYFELAYLDRAIGITTQERELLEHYESLARARYSQGVGSQQAVVRLQAQITRVLNRRQELMRERIGVESTLNALRDRPVNLRHPGRRVERTGFRCGRRRSPECHRPNQRPRSEGGGACRGRRRSPSAPGPAASSARCRRRCRVGAHPRPG